MLFFSKLNQKHFLQNFYKNFESNKIKKKKSISNIWNLINAEDIFTTTLSIQIKNRSNIFFYFIFHLFLLVGG